MDNGATQKCGETVFRNFRGNFKAWMQMSLSQINRLFTLANPANQTFRKTDGNFANRIRIQSVSGH